MGAVVCCKPISTLNSLVLSIPPGKSWTDVHQLEGGCIDGTPGNRAKRVKAKSPSAVLTQGTLAIATLTKVKVHSCMEIQCGAQHCGVLPPQGQLTSGRFLKVAAFVPAFGTQAVKHCPQILNIGFAAFGCEENTIFTFLTVYIGVVCFTIFCGLLFDICFRQRVDFFVEMGLRFTSAKKGSALKETPNVDSLRMQIYHNIANVIPGLQPQAVQIKACTLAERCHEKPMAYQVDLRVNTPVEAINTTKRKLQELTWAAGHSWNEEIKVESTTPVMVRGVAKPPGADLMEVLESFGCCKSRKLSSAAQEALHLETAKNLLRTLQGNMKVVAFCYVGNLMFMTVIPIVAVTQMTCAEGYPRYLHGIWISWVALSQFGVWLYYFMFRSRCTREFFKHFRVRLLLRVVASAISVTDLYQDATFPVIAGSCGFDLWWVSLWLVFLGVGVMQVLAQGALLYGCRQRWVQAQTPQERDRLHVEGIFLALRASDNHMLVYAVKPAVEEILGGASSWAMKTTEARVAFLRFICEDAEQTALQLSFLLFFEEASTLDKVWVGSSTATSLLLSFTLTVQTLAEVRDWLWHVLLAKLPGSKSFPEARFVWLLFFVVIYRAVSIYPWLGSCTPAGNFDDSTLGRLLLITRSPPNRIVMEAVHGTCIAIGLGFATALLAACWWRRQLQLPRIPFLWTCACRSCGCRRWAASRAGTRGSGDNYNFTRRLEKGRRLSLKTEDDEDMWLHGIRALHQAATDVGDGKLQNLLGELDRKAFKATRVQSTVEAGAVEKRSAKAIGYLDDVAAHIDCVKFPSEVTGPTGTEGTQDIIKTLRSQLEKAFDRAKQQGTVLSLLADPTFRGASLRAKADLINDATKGKAPLKLLHYSALEKKGSFPSHDSADSGAEDIKSAIAHTQRLCDDKLTDEEKETWAEKRVVLIYFSHIWDSQHKPDGRNNAKAKTLAHFGRWLQEESRNRGFKNEVYFWVDYSCADLNNDTAILALPLFIASCSQVLVWRRPDFDRHWWTMLERLLTYTFCPGGLTPYAIDGSLLEEPRETEAKVEDLDVAPAARKMFASKIGRTSSQNTVVPEEQVFHMDKMFGDLSTVLPRARKLLDPLDPVVCQTGVGAAGSKKRQIQQLVEIAEALPALEIFADRQPVDFGLTEVMEHWVGPYDPVNNAYFVNADVSSWVKATSSSQASSEWYIKIVRAAWAAPSNLRPNSEHDCAILLVDRRNGCVPPSVAPPDAARIDHLFDQVNKAYEAPAPQRNLWMLGGASMPTLSVEEETVKLVHALEADLYRAKELDTEEALSQAISRSRDAELPLKSTCVRRLCQLQLQNALKAEDLQALTMAMRLTSNSSNEDLAEYKEGQSRRYELEQKQLKKNTIELLSKERLEPSVLVSTVGVAQKNKWDDILQHALGVVEQKVSQAKNTKDPKTIGWVVRLSTCADEQKCEPVAKLAAAGILKYVQSTEHNGDSEAIMTFMEAAGLLGREDLCEQGHAALERIVTSWIKKWKEGQSSAARSVLVTIRDFMKSKVKDTTTSMKSHWQTQQECVQKSIDLMAAEEQKLLTKALLSLPADLQAMAATAQEAQTWGWNAVIDKAEKCFCEAAVAAESQGGVDGITTLSQIYVITKDAKLKANQHAASSLQSTMMGALDAAEKLQMVYAAEAAGCDEFGAQGRQAIMRIIEHWHQHGGAEVTDQLTQLKEIAEEANDMTIVDLVDKIYDAAKAREEAIRQQALDLQAQVTCITERVSFLQFCTRNGIADLANECKTAIQDDADTAIAEGDLQKLAAGLRAAYDWKVQAAKEVLVATVEKLIEDAHKTQDGQTLMLIKTACKGLPVQAAATKAIGKIMTSWDSLEDSETLREKMQLLESSARSCNDLNVASKVRELGLLKEKFNTWAEDREAQGLLMLIDLRSRAMKSSFSVMLEEMTSIVKQVVDNEAGQVSFEDSAFKDKMQQIMESNPDASLVEAVAKGLLALDILSKFDQNDAVEAIRLAAQAQDEKLDGLYRNGCQMIEKRIQQMGREAKRSKTALASLKTAHETALQHGLAEVARQCVEAVGRVLPSDWKVVDIHLGVKKLENTDAVLKARIQQLVNLTFKGWGTHKTPATRDRRTPVAPELKVQQVYHVQNAENFINYVHRRDEVISDFMKLPASERQALFDVKTRQVSMKGTLHHPDEPVDHSVNEYWMWHGTSTAGVTGITDTDFDIGRAGSARGTLYGRGLYFAESCLKADEYAVEDHRKYCPMLLCRVMLGRIFYCDEQYPDTNRLESSCTKSGGYHCVLGDREKARGTFREFIVFDNYQVYPEYIVWYKRAY